MNKLVRDKIIDLIKAEGKSPSFEILSDREYFLALKQKLLEESSEVLQSSSDEELLKELADLQELIDCILTHKKITKTQLKAAQKLKNKSRGSFKKRHFLKN